MTARTTWDPNQYDRFADERGRPFDELVARIRVADPTLVVDLGCGPGALTATLQHRWPNANIVGIDNDENMLAASRAHENSNVRFEPADIATWTPRVPPDVIVANAAFQWVTGHLSLLPALIDSVNPGGALAMQVPGNFEDPHHLAIREVKSRAHWKRALSAIPERAMESYPAATYQSVFARLGCEVDTWETTYVHVLQGDDPVLQWVKGTALRPILSTLTVAEGLDFCAELSELLRATYGTHEWGTPFPFKRIFAVAHRPLR